MKRWVVAGLFGLVGAQSASAQQTQRCVFPNTLNTRQLLVKLPSGQYNTFIGGGFVSHCPAKSLTLKSDSLEQYGDEGRVFLVRNVHYEEPRLILDSDYLTYYERDERIVANGNVNARLPSGSTLKGPVAEYFRAIPGTRPVPKLIASGRPTITLIQRDSTGADAPPTTVVANNVTMVGDSLVYAGGTVQVTRQDVAARGDSMMLDSQREITVMLGHPSIEGKRERPFVLSGDRIELFGAQRKLRRVLAMSNAKAISEDMTLTSDTIDLRIAADLLQRAVAWGPSRAHAFSSAQRIVADSIDVAMPGQRVREMHAVRTALTEGKPDSTRFRADTLDWMRGDTIVARFDTVPSSPSSPSSSSPPSRGDTSRAARIKELIAVGHAKSYYHLPPADSTVRVAAINYVFGREIIVSFQEQRVSKVTVIDKAAGVYLEPKPPPPARVADTTTARSAAVKPPAPSPQRPPQ